MDKSRGTPASSLVERALGGKDKVRFQQCNWRQYPHGRAQPEPDTGRPPPASHSMAFHADTTCRTASRASRTGRWTSCQRSPLTDTSSRTPALCVVPRSGQFETLTEAAEGLGEDYASCRSRGDLQVMTATLHTRLDGDGEVGRRMLHVSYSRWSYEQCRRPERAGNRERGGGQDVRMKAQVGEVMLSDDAAERLFYSSWTAWQRAWGKAASRRSS